MASRTRAPIPGECRRPLTVTMLTVRQNSGSTTGNSDHARVLDGIGRHERETQSGSDHCQRPVVALAPVGRRAGDALFVQYTVGIAREFAVQAVNIILAIHRADGRTARIRQPVFSMHRDHHLLLEERHDVDLVRFLAGQGIDGGFKVAVEQPVSQVGRACVTKPELESGVFHLQQGCTTRPSSVKRVRDLSR